MAQVERKTTVVGNPGRRMFGWGSSTTKRSARAKTGRRPRVSNPGGQILGFTLGNPGRKARMAKAAAKHKSSGRGYAGSRRNPGKKGPKSTQRPFYKLSTHRKTPIKVHTGAQIRHNPGRRYRNPGIAQIGDYTMNAVFVLIGGLGSKLGTQAVLGSNNVGLVGYAANAAVGGVLWFITRMVLKNKNAEAGVISGTILQILLRVINDYTPFGSYVNQLGMGDYQMQSFVTPQILVDPWNSAQIQIPPGWAPALPPPAPAPAASGPGAPAGNSSPHSTGSGRAMAAATGTGTSGLYGRGGGWGGGLYA
jgi:hypothetical protein